ncbi:MAG: ferrous iron transport protein B [Spirochaetales bacterium]|nr:ferrous iron transport protein B [Spirochaetales bacterium]
MRLDDMKPGQTAKVISLGGEGSLRQHFLDMGIIPEAEMTLIKLAPMGDPMEFRLHGYELTLRVSDARNIEVEPLAKATDNAKPSERSRIDHPGLGEDGKYHKKGSGNPLPEDTTLRFALVGNQNSGKTTLFNHLTGSKKHVGNFPGVTVDRKDGMIRGQKNAVVTDLPGIYSMSPYSSEELVSRDFILKEKPHCIINIVDVTSIDRSLYLTMQLLELGITMVLALNMMDEMKGNGGSVDINLMESMLGIPVVPISASKNHGVDELIRHAMHVARNQEGPLRQDFCSSDDNGGAVHRCLHAVIHLIEDHAHAAGIPTRFAASKIIGGDNLILDQLKLDTNEKEMLEHIVLQMENERGMDRNAAMADMRYAYIRKVSSACITKPERSEERIRSQRLDNLLTGKFTAIPMFILIMGVVFFLTFFVIGPFLQDLLAMGIGALGDVVARGMERMNVNPAVRSLVIEGIFEGVGSVLSFLPLIVIMFFFLSLLEDSGYIARVAFVMDKLLRKIGLSGRSIVPMLIGFGCTVPAVMSTRTLPSERDRKMTILLTPFMSCTAKLPIYGFFVNALFPRISWILITALYLLGILVGILVAMLFKRTLFKGEAVPFVMELPNYRMPQAKNVVRLLWEKTKDFLHRAFTVILIATIVVWFLKSFNFRFNLVTDSKDSILATIASLLVPVMRPIGLGDWRLITSLVSGFLAKESVVSTMQMLFRAPVAGITAVSMLVFSLLYTPCVAAVASIKRELGGKWAIGVVLWQCLTAWVVTLVFHLVGLALGFGA